MMAPLDGDFTVARAGCVGWARTTGSSGGTLEVRAAVRDATIAQ
jgi:hypothetical protein